MTPKEYKQMMDYLTRSGIKDQVKFASDLSKPEPKREIVEIEAFNRFNRDYPREGMAGGGMLVQPSADGRRPGYKFKKDPALTKERNKAAKYFFNTNYNEVFDLPFGQDRTTKLSRIDQNLRKNNNKFVKPVSLEERGQAAVDKRMIDDKKKFFKTDKGIQLKWIANNGKNYSSPDKMIQDFLTKFKIKNLENAALFKGIRPSPRDGNMVLGLNMLEGEKYKIIGTQVNPTGRKTDRPLSSFNFKKGTESNLFKLSIIQNNPKVSTNLSNAFNNINKDHAILKKESRLLGVDDALKTLNKKEYQVLKNFGFIQGGLRTGAINSTLRRQGIIDDETVFNFQEIRNPILHTNNIINSLKFDSSRKAFNLSKVDANKVMKGWERVSSGFDDANNFVKEMDNYLGEGKFKQIFGNTTFDHVLAKEFGKRYKDLPKDLLLRGKYTTSTFNSLKLKTFDKPLLDLVQKYNVATGDDKKIISQQIENLYKDFNARTNNYLKDFKPEFGEKVTFKFSKPDFSTVGRYDTSNLAAKEMKDIFKIKDLTKGTGTYNYSKEQLNLFKKEQTKIASLLEKLGCGKAAGGRVFYNEGAMGLTKCAKKGQLKLDNILTKGTSNVDDATLAKTILRAGGGLKSMFALRNIFGPAAIAATVAFEGGLIGYDMLTSGKTLREAFGDNLLNYALGKDYQVDPQEEAFKRYKGLGFSDQQVGRIKKALDAMNTINTGVNLAKDVATQRGALEKSRGQPEPFMGPDDQMMADTSGQRAEQNLKDAQERLTAFNRSLEAVDGPPGGSRTKEDVLSEYFSSGKYAEGLDLLDEAQKAAIVQQKSSAGPEFVGSVLPKFEEGRIQTISENLPFEGANPAFNIPVDGRTYGEGLGAATFIPGKTTGGLFGLAEGGRAGYRLGKIVKPKPSKARTDVKSIMDENIKLIKQMKETGEIDEISSDLNQVIKKALDEDLFDKKDRIVDSINISEAKRRRNYPYNMQVQEEPKNLDFYTAIKESNFRTKTGPYFDRIRRARENKAGGGLLKQAGDRSGAMLESMNPDSQGLPGLLKRVKKQ